ncbi:hypothetical protein SmJEL517_g04577 [Synchytrium microbalum]|uniref:Uncharacterized protein n=1 Tax=Synchytrium microbalum TaxID=1806994 RepID=A0A507C2H3_9FUNG|nr:uncharacterized protein SmJEL517_g04577 [Synchytrium microbalum]TPX32284.1 hypothetical protein SmJEL517_g04577 [Synchytrium microbalum]
MEIPHFIRHLQVQVDPTLSGDRLILPVSLLNEILNLAGENTLPTPLQFLISRGRRRIYGSVKEFTALDSAVHVSVNMASSLESTNGDTVHVKWVELPKAESLKIVPLDEGYLQIQDMRATLEANLRRNYATLTRGETITIEYSIRNPSTGVNETTPLQFLVADFKPSGDGVLIINTDVEVDIEPLDAQQAEKAVKSKLAASAPTTNNVTLQWTSNTEPKASISASVHPNAYVYHQIKPLPNYEHYIVDIERISGDIDVFISMQQARPSELDHDYYNVESKSSSSTHISSSNMDPSLPMIYSGIRSASNVEAKYSLTIRPTNEAPAPRAQVDVFAMPVDEPPLNDDETTCSNCLQRIPKRTITMHEAFCLRNNAYCGRCKKVFKKGDYASHWHCDECDMAGNISEMDKHMSRIHTPLSCTCGKSLTLPELAQHKRESCPDRYIICKYCHLRLKAGPPSTSVKDWTLGLQLSQHESECGARTIECVTCKKPVQLKEVTSHMKIHDLEKRAMVMSGPTIKLCSNVECSNSVSEQYPNTLKLCQSCFAPFWSPRLDEGNKRLAQKLLETYHNQMTRGCGRSHCLNQHCRTFLKPSEEPDATESAVQALTMVKKSALVNQSNPECYLCVADAAVNKRRKMADELSVIYRVPLSSGIRALTMANDDQEKASEWIASATLPK